jgi:hypothetical protein
LKTEWNDMMEPDPFGAAGEAHGDNAAAARMACLSEEIEFWTGMLETSRDTAPAESIERMTCALALAEYRLRTLQHGKNF